MILMGKSHGFHGSRSPGYVLRPHGCLLGGRQLRPGDRRGAIVVADQLEQDSAAMGTNQGASGTKWGFDHGQVGLNMIYNMIQHDSTDSTWSTMI